MNSLRTAARRTAYALEVFQLHRPYRSAESLQNATRLHHYESDTDFGSFRNSHPTKYLGVIQHVHHWLGEGDEGELVHRTLLYVFDGVA